MKPENLEDFKETFAGSVNSDPTLVPMPDSAQTSKEVMPFPSLPPQASFMGIPLELRLLIYDLLLPDELSISYLEYPEHSWFEGQRSIPKGVRKRTNFGKLLITSHKIRREVMRYAPVRRELRFDFTGKVGSYIWFNITDTLRVNAGCLTSFKLEEKGSCPRVSVALTYETFGNIEKHDTEPNEEAELWSAFCKALPPCEEFVLEICGICCPAGGPPFCVIPKPLTLTAIIGMDARLNSSRFACVFVESAPQVRHFTVSRAYHIEDTILADFCGLINGALCERRSEVKSTKE